MTQRKSFYLALAAATLVAVTGVAVAQSAGGHPPRHGPPGGMGIEHVLIGLKASLGLDTSQSLTWDQAVAASQAAHVAERANMQKIHDELAAQLASPTPDLAAVAAVADSVQASNQTLRQGVRAQWLQIYANFSDAQKAIVAAALVQQQARMAAWAAKMKAAHAQPGG